MADKDGNWIETIVSLELLFVSSLFGKKGEIGVYASAFFL